MRKFLFLVVTALLFVTASCKKVDQPSGDGDIFPIGIKSFTYSYGAGSQSIADIDEKTHTIHIRHISDGSMITGFNYVPAEGAVVETNLDQYVGNCPKEFNISVKCAEGKTSYTAVLCDYISPTDYYIADTRKWKLEWSDEFNGTQVDWNVWERCSRGTPDWCNTMCDREDLCVLQNGSVLLKGIENTVDPSDTSKFLTAGLSSSGKKSFKLGRIDIRARFTQAQGFWPALWMMPDSNLKWPYAGEIDILEHVNYQGQLHQALISEYTKYHADEKQADHEIMVPHNASGYILFTVEMHDNYIQFKVDGSATLRYDKIDALVSAGQFPFDKYNYYPILSAQLGGTWAGTPDASSLPAILYVDFVRYYSAVGASSPDNPDKPDIPDNPVNPDQPIGSDSNSIGDLDYHKYEL